MWRIARQRILDPHSCWPRSDYFSQTGAGWEVGDIYFSIFCMCSLHLVWLGVDSGGGGVSKSSGIPIRGYYHACGVGSSLKFSKSANNYRTQYSPPPFLSLALSLSFFFLFLPPNAFLEAEAGQVSKGAAVTTIPHFKVKQQLHNFQPLSLGGY